MIQKSHGVLRIFNTWALLECDRQIGGMYRSLYSLEYFYRPKIQEPLWDSHISIIRGETTLVQSTKEELQGMLIEYFYIPEMQTNGCHYWLPVICPLLDDIRKAFSLGKSPINYHLSIGNTKHDTSLSTIN